MVSGMLGLTEIPSLPLELPSPHMGDRTLTFKSVFALAAPSLKTPPGFHCPQSPLQKP